MGKKKKVALVTGGNKGIGYEICRGLAKAGCTVILSGRDEGRVSTAVKRLRRSKLDVVGLTLEVTDPVSIAAAVRFVQRQYGRLQILVNNAAVFIDHPKNKTVETMDLETMRVSMDVNFFGPMRLIKAFLPIMIEQQYGRIVNVSSGMGQLNESGPNNGGYRISKTALNSLTRLVAVENDSHGIRCNAVSPGWVRTDMGGPDAERTPRKGAESVIKLALMGNESPNGGFFRDMEEIPW